MNSFSAEKQIDEKVSIINKTLFCLLFFIFIYPLKFSFFPFISTRVFMGCLGILFFFIDHLKYTPNKFFLIKREWAITLLLLGGVLVAALFTNILNKTKELYFILYPASIILILSSAYFVIRVVRRKYNNINFQLIAKYIVAAVVLQMMLTALMIIFPSSKAMLRLLTEDLRLEIFMNASTELRIIGFGSQYFAAGVVNSFALLLIASLIKQLPGKSKLIIYYVLGFVLIVVIGSMMSRTTLVGAGISIFIFLYHSRIWHFKLSKRGRVVLNSLLFLVILFAISLLFLPERMINRFDSFSNFAFEFFHNYFEKGEFSSESTSQLISMFKTYPSNIKTWIIGDGYYADPESPELYYMATDVGYARLLFYFGIIGTFFYFAYQMALAWFANKETGRKNKFFFLSAMVLMFILNFKGFTDFTPLFGLFLFCNKQ